ncbi:hypothetical protein SM8_009645 [Streptomyces sp. SM8]|nr:hypothetical protein SM8_009645 [Streptomyces sp. SM8]
MGVVGRARGLLGGDLGTGVAAGALLAARGGRSGTLGGGLGRRRLPCLGVAVLVGDGGTH